MSILQIKLGKKKISLELSFATYSLCMKTINSIFFQLFLGHKDEYLIKVTNIVYVEKLKYPKYF